jgi:hypothetical protein
MPLEGQWQRQQSAFWPARRREARLLIVLGCVLLAATVAVVVAVVVQGGAGTARAGCVEVTAATSTGGATLHACGADARHWCRLEAARTDPFARMVQEHCRKARIGRP